MNRKAKGKGFTQRSGKSPAFKMIGSSPTRLFNPTDQTLAYSGTKEEVEAKHQKFLEGLPGWGVATGHGAGGYTDRYGRTATKGIDEFDTSVRTARSKRRRQRKSREELNARMGKRMQDERAAREAGVSIDEYLSGGENLSNEDFWSQYSF